MRSLILIAIIISFGYLSMGQTFERKIFDYSQLPENDTILCADSIQEKVNRVTELIEKLQSDKAVSFAEKVFNESEKCPRLYELYSWAMFSNGKWLESMSLIDSAILIYGANPDLILTRGHMNLQMAEAGVGVRNIDGNAVYLPKSKQLPYDNASFKQANYLAALSDFKHIAETYTDRFQEIYLIGYIYKMLESYEESNEYWSRLLFHEEFGDDFAIMIADNYISMKKYPESEKILTELEKKDARNPEIYKQLRRLYKLTGETAKLELAQSKLNFYSWVPEYCDLEFSPGNYETVSFLVEDNPPVQKWKRMKKLRKLDESSAVDICLTVLNTHTNHGNGIEEAAAEFLLKTGNTVVPKVILLMQNAPSTCTVTMSAAILADLKDPRGWQPMVDYLPRMETIPFTLIPPSVPEQIIRFDREKGLNALLEYIKGTLGEEDPESGNPLAEFGSMLSSGMIYSPLLEFEREEIIKAASELNYTEAQLEKLLSRLQWDKE